jgi:uncharacterized protein
MQEPPRGSAIDMQASWETALAAYVEPFVRDDPTGHDIYHCLRVKRLALRIADGQQSAGSEGLDRDVLVATAYLHDVGRGREWQGEGDHVDMGVAAAQEVLPGTGFPLEKIQAVVHCIQHHEEYEWARDVTTCHDAANCDAENQVYSPEVLAFQDADRLDAIGAVGLARMFCFGGAYRRPLWIPEVEPGFWQHGEIGGSTYTHLYEKLFKLKDTMNTATGCAMAEARHAFMERFAAEFESEWSGEA